MESKCNSENKEYNKLGFKNNLSLNYLTNIEPLSDINSLILAYKMYKEHYSEFEEILKNENYSNNIYRNVAIDGDYGSGKTSILKSVLFFTDIKNNNYGLYSELEMILDDVIRNGNKEKLGNKEKIDDNKKSDNKEKLGNKEKLEKQFVELNKWKNNNISNEIFISLATLENDNNNINNYKNKDSEEIEYWNNIQKNIIYQITSQTNYDKYSKSDLFTKPVNTKINTKLSMILAGISGIILTLIILLYFKSDSYGLKALFNSSDNKVSVGWIWFIVLFIIMLPIFVYYSYNFFTKNKIKINVLKYKDVGVELNTNDKKDYFNDNIDDVIYLFTSINKTVFIFEDIDRFENHHYLLKKLRDLNVLVNNHLKVSDNEELKNRTISFLYPLNINQLSHENSTKFFDIVIPIFPIENNSDLNDVIVEKFKDYFNQNKDTSNQNKDNSTQNKKSEKATKEKMRENINSAFFVLNDLYKEINNQYNDEFNKSNDVLNSIIEFLNKDTLINVFKKNINNRRILNNILNDITIIKERYAYRESLEENSTPFLSNYNDIIHLYIFLFLKNVESYKSKLFLNFKKNKGDLYEILNYIRTTKESILFTIRTYFRQSVFEDENKEVEKVENEEAKKDENEIEKFREDIENFIKSFPLFGIYFLLKPLTYFKENKKEDTVFENINDILKYKTFDEEDENTSLKFFVLGSSIAGFIEEDMFRYATGDFKNNKNKSFDYDSYIDWKINKKDRINGYKKHFFALPMRTRIEIMDKIEHCAKNINGLLKKYFPNNDKSELNK